MSIIYFIDESGNSGDIATSAWTQSLNEQPYFVMASVGATDENVINNIARDIIKKYKIQSKELKSSSIFKKRKFIVEDLVESLLKNDCRILVEIVDKKYQICMAIVDYFVFCPYFEPSETSTFSDIKKTVCDILYDNVSEQDMQDYIAAFDSIDHDSVVDINRCFENFKRIFSSFNLKYASVLGGLVEESRVIFERIKAIDGCIVAKKRFLPLPDYSNGREYNLLPNVNCLAHVYARINMAEGSLSGVQIVHDEQREFKDALEDIIKTVENLSSDNSTVTPYANFNIKNCGAIFSFDRSVDRYGIQIADLVAGFCMRHVLSVAKDEDVAAEFTRTYLKLGMITSAKIGINQVLPTMLLRKLYQPLLEILSGNPL